jgi:[ribosomal protein S5]-alanine N-acetyltransferase
MTILQTNRLLMRHWTKDDVEKVSKFWGNHDTMKYCAGALSDKYISMVVNSIINFQNENGYTFLFPIVLKETNDVIGVCGLQKTKDANVFELLYHFREDTWGNGYAFEAAKPVLEYGIEKLNPQKIIASAAVENIGSWKILEKLNFSFLEEKLDDDTQLIGRYYELTV